MKLFNYWAWNVFKTPWIKTCENHEKTMLQQIQLRNIIQFYFLRGNSSEFLSAREKETGSLHETAAERARARIQQHQVHYKGEETADLIFYQPFWETSDYLVSKPSSQGQENNTSTLKRIWILLTLLLYYYYYILQSLYPYSYITYVVRPIHRQFSY